MPTYLALHKHRKDGAQRIKQLPERMEKAKQLAHSMDCDVEYYLTTANTTPQSLLTHQTKKPRNN